MVIPDLVGSIRNLLGELNIDQAVIDDVLNTLHTSSSDLDSSRFPDLHVPESSFGGSEKGVELGYHHLKAHQVVSDTLQGVVMDLERFLDGVRNAEKLVQSADTTSAADLNRKRQATDLILDATQHSEGDLRNHEARNEHLGNGATSPGNGRTP